MAPASHTHMASASHTWLLHDTHTWLLPHTHSFCLTHMAPVSHTKAPASRTHTHTWLLHDTHTLGSCMTQAHGSCFTHTLGSCITHLAPIHHAFETLENSHLLALQQPFLEAELQTLPFPHRPPGGSSGDDCGLCGRPVLSWLRARGLAGDGFQGGDLRGCCTGGFSASRVGGWTSDAVALHWVGSGVEWVGLTFVRKPWSVTLMWTVGKAVLDNTGLLAHLGVPLAKIVPLSQDHLSGPKTWSWRLDMVPSGTCPGGGPIIY